MIFFILFLFSSLLCFRPDERSNQLMLVDLSMLSKVFSSMRTHHKEHEEKMTKPVGNIETQTCLTQSK